MPSNGIDGFQKLCHHPIEVASPLFEALLSLDNLPARNRERQVPGSTLVHLGADVLLRVHSAQLIEVLGHLFVRLAEWNVLLDQFEGAVSCEDLRTEPFEQ